MYCTYTHKRRAHTCTHTNTHSLEQTPQPGKLSPARVQRAAPRGGLNVPASRLLRTNTSIHRILYTWEIKNGWSKLQLSYKEPSCKLPSYTAAVPAVPHCAPSAEWIHQCCSGWPDHTLGDALHPGLPWYYSSDQVLHCFHLSTEAWLGSNKKHGLDLSSHFFSSNPWNSDNWLFHLLF